LEINIIVRRPETVGQRALQRREQKLHQRPGGAEDTENLRRLLRIAADEVNDELR
jgi:hypothetical protein